MALYEEFEPQPNRLIDAQSAYLRSAAYQPIGWYEFGPEAFTEAKRQQKPILLDIGAVWCHWCHVIDHESYEDPEIATLINEEFIPVKVDRDERPDIDARYQTAVQLLTGQGGWPLTVFLDEEGNPFFGGTYFPPEDREGRVGMKSLLPRIAASYRNRRPELAMTARSLVERTRKANLGVAKAGRLSEKTYQKILSDTHARFNAEQGGFEHTGPKFPHTGAIELALLHWDISGDDAWRYVFERTLVMMGRGGIYDHLGGGFHRYSTDADWRVPHFEKMSYDNALILENYVHAYRATGNEFLREIAEGTLDCILRDFADRERGGFFAAQDADNSLHDDGSYWTWSMEEFTQALAPEEAEVLARYFGMRMIGDMPETGRNVLHLASTPEQIAQTMEIPVDEVRQRIARGKTKLLERRRHRKTPRIDTSKFANWNALLISACLTTGALLGRDDATRFALTAVDTILKDAYEADHGIYHTFHTGVGADNPGFLEDQIYTARALLDAFMVSGDRVYFETAHHLLDLCIAQYWDEEGGGFFDVARDRAAAAHTSLLSQPRKVIEDMPVPSPNAIAALTLDRLWLLTHDERYREYAEKTLKAFAAHADDYGHFAGYYGMAAYLHLHSPALAVIIGDRDSDATRQLWQAALATYRPGRMVAVFAPDAISERYPPGKEGEPVAYVCAGEACAAPTGIPEELQQQLRKFGR